MYLEFFQVRSFEANNFGKKLVFQSINSDGEIDERCLCLHLRFVVRIGKLGVQDQTEMRMKLNLLLTNFDKP